MGVCVFAGTVRGRRVLACSRGRASVGAGSMGLGVGAWENLRAVRPGSWSAGVLGCKLS